MALEGMLSDHLVYLAAPEKCGRTPLHAWSPAACTRQRTWWSDEVDWGAHTCWGMNREAGNGLPEKIETDWRKRERKENREGLLSGGKGGYRGKGWSRESGYIISLVGREVFFRCVLDHIFIVVDFTGIMCWDIRNAFLISFFPYII